MRLPGRLYARASAPTAIDYGLVAVLIVVAMMAAVTAFGHDLKSAWIRTPAGPGVAGKS
jgi:Flp pilus assembly pilin Flp